MDVRSSYDSAASAYAEHLFAELDQKPLDRHLLNRFAESVAGRGVVADLGCGPGHVSKYLHARGVSVRGVDLSPEMVRCAATLSREIDFRVGDMRALGDAAGTYAGIVSFYSIVHLRPSELDPVFREWRRVVASDALVLLGFHVGDERVHLDDLWGRPVLLDFQFHQPEAVMIGLESAGFTVRESAQREPYPNAEYQSRRCYLLATAV